MQVRGSDDTLEFADKFRNLHLEEKTKYIAQIVKVKQI